MTEQTVPDELLGCWQRRWIEFADGTRDDTSFVVWVQLASLMADLRLSAAACALVGRGGFAACSTDELLVLADGDSSSGATSCTPVVVGTDGVRRATAKWTSSVSVQPMSAFPEPGLLEWNADGTVLIERAPSGAYIEEWRLMPGSRGRLRHSTLADGAEWYQAGDAGLLVRNRIRPTPTCARLTEIVDRSALEAALDCEFSYARRTGTAFVVEASTLPWRVGAVLPATNRVGESG
jgi:hypothetical protein